MNTVRDLIDKYYGSVLIGERALESTIREFLRLDGTRLLDAGCGDDAPFTRRFCNEAPVVGMDLSRALPKDLQMVCGDLSRLPFSDEAFSIVFSRSVFEHLLEPEKVMDDIHRALKPGGF